MKIRKYIARNMPEALQQVRDDFGRDAVILSTRQLRRNSRFNPTDQNQVEVTAAYDNEITSEVTEISPTDTNSILGDISHEDAYVPEKKSNVSHDFMENRNTPVNKDEQINIAIENYQEKQEFKNSSANNNKNKSNIDKMCYEFRKNGITEEIIERLFHSLLNEDKNHNPKTYTELLSFADNWFRSQLPGCRRLRINQKRQVIGFVGSAGAGKTTAIAKIAGSLAEMRQDGVVIISTDNRRIGALDQLQSLSQIIDVPYETAFDDMEMRLTLERHKVANFVLIDAPGYGCRDETGYRELKRIYSSVDVKEVYIVLDATNDFQHMMDIIRSSSVFPNPRLLFTKLDQVSRIGTILSASFCSEIPTSYISTSDQISGGIEPANMNKMFTEMLGNYRQQVLDDE